MLTPCTCGEPHPHVIAERRTLDGHGVELWSDGAILTPFGQRVRGVPMRRPRSPESQRLALRAGALFMGEACITSDDDLGAPYAACVSVAKRDGLPGDVRAEMRAAEAVPPLALKPSWTVVSADSRGCPTERVWTLPRLRWPGMVVFDFCGGPGSARGRYRLFERRRSIGVGGRPGDALHDTGFAFRRLSDLFAHLQS
jgi:hypothetical protein